MTSPSALPLTPRADPLASSFATSYAGVVAFIAVVTEGSFARAADRLGIGRSAVSRSVQKLEDQLNVRLFLRTTRSTTLTREGDLFYANCHTGVDRIVQAVEEMRDLRQGPPRGHLRISAAVGFGRARVAPLRAGLRDLPRRHHRPAAERQAGRLHLGSRRHRVSRRPHGRRADHRQADHPHAAAAVRLARLQAAHGLPASVEALADHEVHRLPFLVGASSSGSSRWAASRASSCHRPSSPTTTPTSCCRPCSMAMASPSCRATWPARR